MFAKSSQSLWNHKQRCKDTGERKRSRNTDGFSEKHDDPTTGIEKKTGSMNPKIKLLLDEIINDNSTETALDTLPSPLPPPPTILSQKEVISKLPQQAIAELFLPKVSVPDKVTAELLPLSARTKADIMGYSDGESSEEQSSDDGDQ